MNGDAVGSKLNGKKTCSPQQGVSADILSQ